MRQVRGADGRVWTLSGELEWRAPATADDFEHDISAGRGPAIVMLLLVVLLTVVLIVWTPPDVDPPAFLILSILLIVLFFPIRWMFNRRWKITADTGDDGNGEPTEKWIGTVRGAFTVRQQLTRTTREIAEESSPDAEGPLRRVIPQVIPE